MKSTQKQWLDACWVAVGVHWSVTVHALAIGAWPLVAHVELMTDDLGAEVTMPWGTRITPEVGCTDAFTLTTRVCPKVKFIMVPSSNDSIGSIVTAPALALATASVLEVPSMTRKEMSRGTSELGSDSLY